MLENDDSKMQTKFWVHITSNIFKKKKKRNFKSRDYTSSHEIPTLKAYPTPGGGGRLDFFPLK